MRIEEIRKGAPEGATHYYKISGNVILYYRYIDDESWVFVFTDWMLSAYQDRIIKPL